MSKCVIGPNSNVKIRFRMSKCDIRPEFECQKTKSEKRKTKSEKRKTKNKLTSPLIEYRKTKNEKQTNFTLILLNVLFCVLNSIIKASIERENLELSVSKLKYAFVGRLMCVFV